ncbi:uncharacterized protein LOC111257696 [Setaria italica]|uniref:uncharacterized protein LOC111257696 n=1 Tax=Setaria italica TaxID=4555 RepID=UPI000647F435|nr:uncharacterized protein LOC111257696 [Setaria italica]
MATSERSSSTAAPYFDGSDYRYWKTRMRAHLNSKGIGIWEITQDINYVIPATRVTQDDRDKYHANNKAVDILFASLSRAEFDRVEDLTLAHEIWSRLQSFHEGNSQVKARLFETYRREYENFVHLPSESADALFQRFLAIVNKMKANITILPYTDHNRALKIIHALDHEVWGTKVDAIIESPNYKTLSTDELFAKLKSTEVDKRLRAKQGSPTNPSSMALMSGSGQPKALSNSSSMLFALSSLLSVLDEQLEVLDDDELALITRRFMRFNDNHKNWRRSNNNCFECGKPGHFTADCPDKNKTRSGYYVMALNTDNKKDDKESDSDTETEVKATPKQLSLKIEGLNDCLINQDKLIKKVARERVELKAKLESALIEIDMLKSAPIVSDNVECNECVVHMDSLASLQSKHALLVDELDLTRAALDEVKTRPVLLGASAGEHEMGQSIFEEEDKRADSGDEENDEVNRAPATAPIPSTLTTRFDGPTSTSTTSSHHQVPLQDDEEEDESEQAIVEGEATSERGVPRHIQRFTETLSPPSG